MSTDESPQLSRSERRTFEEVLPFQNRQELESRFEGLQMERILEMLHTEEGKQQLLRMMKEQDPSLNGNIEAASNTVQQNIEQLKTKESFFEKVAKLPGRGLKAVGRSFKKHPVLTTAAGIAAVLALLYFLPATGGVGAFQAAMIERIKSTLMKLGISSPAASLEATATTTITGGEATTEVLQQGAELLQSPGAVQEHVNQLQQILEMQ